MQPRPTNSLTSQMARRWCLRNTKKANRTEPTIGFLSSFRHTSAREKRMGIQELYDRYLDIYCCGSNENRLLRCSIRIHPFFRIQWIFTRLKPLQPLSTQEFTDVFCVPPFDACVPLIFSRTSLCCH